MQRAPQLSKSTKPSLHATVASIAAVAALTAGLGWLLAQQAAWPQHRVLAGLLGYLVIGLVVVFAASRRLRGGSFGLANQVTLLRSALVCLIGSALLASGQAPVQGWSVAALVATALVLDLIDGQVARRLGLASAFGARFDMEVDALLILILALLVWQVGRVDAWVLAIGLMRYGFVLAGWLFAWLRAPLPPSRRRQAVCAVQGVSLLVCVLPPVTPWMAGLVAGLALTALAGSFAADMRWLWLTRRSPAGPLPGAARLIAATRAPYWRAQRAACGRVQGGIARATRRALATPPGTGLS
jgi:phosphatidylglycerophosphate synthase